MIQTVPFPRGCHEWHPFWTESGRDRVRMVSGFVTLIMRDGMIKVSCENIFCPMMVRVSAGYMRQTGCCHAQRVGDGWKFDQ